MAKLLSYLSWRNNLPRKFVGRQPLFRRGIVGQFLESLQIRAIIGLFTLPLFLSGCLPGGGSGKFDHIEDEQEKAQAIAQHYGEVLSGGQKGNSSNAQGDEPSPQELQWLLAAYPDHLSHTQGNYLVWKDSTEMFDTGLSRLKDDSLRFQQPDLSDMFRWDYLMVDSPLVHGEADPGRIRHPEFFAKMYGESKAEVEQHLKVVRWLPSSVNLPLKVTTINGAADALQAISDELDQRPELRKYLDNPAGTYNYRKIAGTNMLSAHSWGIAVDINVKFSNYWRWSPEFKKGQSLQYQNKIPLKIVHIFEKHGFIWGGRWYHYDSMHFEYRPEFFAPAYRTFVERRNQE